VLARTPYGRLKRAPKLPAKPVLQSSESSSATDDLSGSEESSSSCLEDADAEAVQVKVKWLKECLYETLFYCHILSHVLLSHIVTCLIVTYCHIFYCHIFYCHALSHFNHLEAIQISRLETDMSIMKNSNRYSRN
jgi:hypothetical protein